MDWRSEFAEFGDVAYLNMATQGPLPKAAARAAQQALEWKKLPHTIPEDAYFGLPDRVRALLARLIGAQPHEIALTSGASGGLLSLAGALDWQPEDEVLIAQGEFPAHRSVWLPLAQAGRLRLRVVQAFGRFLTADDFAAQLTPRTRLVSTSLVRFDNAVRLDARRLADACHAAGAWLLLDVSQCAGALPLDVSSLGADFLVCAGYKWLLGPYGTGFFWARSSVVDALRPSPIYWQAVEGAAEFHSLADSPMRPLAGARRWDMPETGNFFNLAAWEKSLEFILNVGVEVIWNYNQSLVQQVIARFPRDRCILTSPAEPAARGPFICLAGRAAERTRELFERLREARVIVALREGNLRIAPYLFNTERDIDRLVMTITV